MNAASILSTLAARAAAAEPRYAWIGSVWSYEASPEGDTDKDVVVSTEGVRKPASALMGALFRGEALQVPSEPASEPAPAPAAPAAPASEPKAGEHDEAGKARAAAKIAHAASLGVTLPASKADGLFFDLGTTVMAESWTSERRAFEALPAGATRLPALRDAIRGEDREDVTVPAWSIRMGSVSGKLGPARNGSDRPTESEQWKPTKRGLAGFYTRSGIGTVPDHWPTDVRARAVNDLCKRFATERPTDLLVDGQDPMVVLRVQRARGKVFACVSPSYTKFDGDLVVDALINALPQGARVDVDYDADLGRGRVEIITLQTERPVVGEPFRTSFTLGWDDTGSGSIWGDGGIFSVRCLNLTRIYTEAGTFRLRHVGSVGALARKFRMHFDRISRVVHGFANAYGQAAEETLTNEERREGTDFLQGIYRSLLQRDLVPVKGRREEAVKALAIQALADENKAGLTRAGIANGITRYAHRVNTDPWLRDELERAAGRIIQADRRPIPLTYLAAE